MTVREALKTAAARLEQAGVPEARVDARALLSGVLKVPALQLLAGPDCALGEEDAARFFQLVARRALREPLQYIQGWAPFMSREFRVSPGVLIPRQDTESLCLRAIALAGSQADVLDVCCGSGCLAVSLKLARPDCAVSAGDLSPDAIALTKENAFRLGAAVDLLQGDLFAPFMGLRFDLILSNPPYIPAGELPGLQAEVGFEPALALDGGPDGLAFYRRIIKEAPNYLKPGGVLLLELGDGQQAAVSNMLGDGFSPAVIHFDLGGLPRVLETRFQGGVE